MAGVGARGRRLIERGHPELLRSHPGFLVRRVDELVAVGASRMEGDPEVSTGRDGSERRLVVEVLIARPAANG